MPSADEFGPDTETIRAWLSKRASYADDVRIVGATGSAPTAADPAPQAPSARSTETHPDDHAPPEARDRPGVPDGVDASRAVLSALDEDASGTHSSAPRKRREPDAAAEIPPPTTPGQVPAPAEVRVGRWTEPIDNITAARASTNVEFPVRAGVPHALAILLVAGAAATAVASYLAWQQPTTTTVGAAGALGLLTLVVWAARAGSAMTVLSIRHGQLTVRRGGRLEVVDLANHHTPIAIVGQPGQRRWRVLIERPGLPLTVISPAMVNPHLFTAALQRIRPDLRPQAQAGPREPSEHGDTDEHGGGPVS